MSDQAPGPGWWKASDGQWYPPQPPTAQQPPVYPPAAPQSPPTAQQPPVYPPGYEPQPQAYPPQPATYAPQPPAGGGGGSKTGLIVLIGALVVVAGIVVALLAFGGSDDDDDDANGSASSAASSTTVADDGRVRPVDGAAGVKVVGGTGDDGETVVVNAIVELQRFWTATMPEVFGQEYQPVQGGFYSASPDEELPPCAQSSDDIAGNAFYCPSEDVVAWDDTGLVPKLRKEYDDLAVAVVMAHEWGHAVQARAGLTGATVTMEHQADCFAGAWVGHISNTEGSSFKVTARSIDNALAGFLELADTPGTAATDATAHGSAFDRVNGFVDGVEGGAAKCATYRDDNVTLVELPFTDQADLDRGGNLPYEGSADLAIADLEDYWSKVAAEEGKTWTPLNPAEPFDGASGETPSCGDDDTSGFKLFYCAAGRFIAYDDTEVMPRVHEALGDFATATLLATQYGLAVLDQVGGIGNDPKAENLAADCLAGSWAASVFLGNRPDSGSLTLSPGDLDEAVKALLVFSSSVSDENPEQGAGFERVDSFRSGVLGGVEACSG